MLLLASMQNYIMYKKHNVFLGNYVVKDKKIVPEGSYIVMKQLDGGSVFSRDLEEEGSIVLILEDKNFWPIMSFLTAKEALELSDRLRLAASD